MTNTNNISIRQTLEAKYNNSRTNLLWVLIFTLINFVLLVTQSNTYLLFSAYIPYFLVDLGMILCGKYPAEYYGVEFSNIEFYGSGVFAVFLGLAIVITTMYFVCWLCSKNNKLGWMIFALVFFSIDTVLMFVITGIQFASIIDIVFHVWVIVSLIMGISAGFKLKKLPADEVEVTGEVVASEEEVAEKVEDGNTESKVMRIADTNVKARILLQSNTFGHTVIYRRVKRANELVIDGNVYDEIEALVEMAHTLKAQIDGHLIEVGFDGVMHSFLKVDGQTVTKKFRIY